MTEEDISSDWLATYDDFSGRQHSILTHFGEKIACFFPKLTGKVEFNMVNGQCKSFHIQHGGRVEGAKNGKRTNG
jgi:hypothetical protein